jgi:proteasome lid subunit RPN8/RPN11
MEFYISQKDWKKVIDYAQSSYDQFKSEIGGFMVAKTDKDGDIIISEPEILEQEVTGGTTVMDRAAVADYYVKCAEKHGPGVRFIWWHSHANMSAFWSGTDTNTMEEYSSGDWSAFLVVNIRQEYKFRVCVWNPIKAYKDIDLKIIGAKPKKVPKAISESVTKLCSKPTAIVSSVKNWRQTSIYDNNWYGNYNSSKDFNVSYVSPSLNDVKSVVASSEDNLMTATLDMIDEFNSLYAEGEFSFKDWLKSVKQWNVTLKKKKANYNIKELTENELHEHCGYYANYDPINLLNLEDRDGKNNKV